METGGVSWNHDPSPVDKTPQTFSVKWDRRSCGFFFFFGFGQGFRCIKKLDKIQPYKSYYLLVNMQEVNEQFCKETSHSWL